MGIGAVEQSAAPFSQLIILLYERVTIMACENCTKTRISEEDADECIADFNRYEESGCYTTADIGKNLFCALKGIGTQIGLLVDAQEKKGFASGVLPFRIDARSYTNGAVINNQLSRAPLNYKITGFGVSCITFPSSAGIYAADDIITVKLYDFTGSNQIGNTLTLNATQLHDKHTDEGAIIGNNIASGHIFGVKVGYTNDDAGAFTGPIIDVYIHIEPVELITEI